MTAKKIFCVLVGLFLGLALMLAGCGPDRTGENPGGSSGKEPYKIGVVLDASGPASTLGKPEWDTARMVEEKINAQGGINGHPLKLVMYDNKSDATEGVLIAKKLIEQDKVLAIIGSSTSGTTLAMVDTVQKAGIPLVSAAASIKIVEPAEERRWVFKTAQSDTLIAEKIIDYLKTNGLTNIAFMSVNSAYGDSGLVEFEKVAAREGINLLIKEKFGENDKDMTAQLIRVKGRNPQAVVVWAINPPAPILTKNYRQLGINAPLIHSHGVGNKAFIELAGEAANGVIFATGKLLVAGALTPEDPQKQVLEDYINDYQGKYGTMPNAFGGYAADALGLVIEALKKAGPDPAKIRDQLEKTQNYVGVTGVFNLSPADHNGLDKADQVMVEIVDGQWKLIK